MDVPDTPSNRQWIRAFKDRWKTKLEQFELYVVSYSLGSILQIMGPPTAPAPPTGLRVVR